MWKLTIVMLHHLSIHVMTFLAKEHRINAWSEVSSTRLHWQHVVDGNIIPYLESAIADGMRPIFALQMKHLTFSGISLIQLILPISMGPVFSKAWRRALTDYFSSLVRSHFHKTSFASWYFFNDFSCGMPALSRSCLMHVILFHTSVNVFKE